MHKGENQSASGPLREDPKDANVDGGERVSPARDRAADQVVARATQGLMRVDLQRRKRLLFRRLFFVLIFGGAIAGLYYFFADDVPTDLLSKYWEQLKEKLLLPVS